MASKFTILQQGLVGTYDITFDFTFENDNDFVNTVTTDYDPTITSDGRALTYTIPYNDATPLFDMGVYVENFGVPGNSFTCYISSYYVQNVAIDKIQNCEASNRDRLITIKNVQDDFFVGGTFDVVIPGLSVEITATFRINFW